ncbi:hypothetical protein [Nocardioides sp. URHA0032]|uniref:hypothetical protein n=1 Tax=Nocardioides sp. URHA0032 TaxID=1380388 RepID=UPI000490B83D|nr:hypothetical protein [Nocardioides sp. URHA0032]
MTEPNQLDHPANKAYMQTAFLVELLLGNQHNDVRDVVQAMPDDEIMPLLGAALIFGAEAMRDHFGRDGAVEQIAAIRQQVGRGGFND